MKINEVDGLLIATFHDHDGINHGEIKPIAKSRYETFKNKLEYGRHEEILEYLDTFPSIKAKKRK